MIAAVTQQSKLDTLAKKIRKGFAISKKNERQSIRLGRTSVVDFFRAGKLLVEARALVDKQKTVTWTQWLKKEKIARTTQWEATTLYKNAKTEKALASVDDLTSAKIKYGAIRKHPKVKPPENEDDDDDWHGEDGDENDHDENDENENEGDENDSEDDETEGEENQNDNEGSGPLDAVPVDILLIAIGQRLEKILKEDLSSCDPKQIDKLATNCMATLIQIKTKVGAYAQT